MAGPAHATLIPLQQYYGTGAGAADCHPHQFDGQLLLSGSAHGLQLDPIAAAAPGPNDIFSLQQHYGSDCLSTELAVCSLRPRVFERSPSLISFVSPPPPPPPPPSKLVMHLDGGPTILKAAHMDVAIPLCPLPPDLATPSLSTVLLDRFNAACDYYCGAPLERQESFDFILSADQSNLWDPLDDEFNRGVAFQATLASNMPPESVMDVCNNQNAVTHFVGQVSQLETTVCNDSVALQHLNYQSTLPGLQSPISCPPPSSPTYMDGINTVYTGAISDPMHALGSSNATSYTSSCSLYQTSNAHLEALISPTSSYGVNMEEELHESFHEVEDMGSVQGGNLAATRWVNMEEELHESFLEVEDMGFEHGGNQEATRQSKTEFYRRIDRLAWRKHGQAGGIKTKKRPRSTSFSVTTHGGTFEDMDPIYDDNKVGIRLKTDNVNPDDGFTWFKYGQKPIINHKHPRSYLKCVESTRSGCKAQKRIKRCSHHEEYVKFIYLGRHNHSP